MALNLPPPIVQKTLATKALKHENGNLLLWDTPVILEPIQMNVLKAKLEEEYYGADKAHKLVYFLGKIQAKTGFSIINKRFGYAETLKDKQALLQFNMGQYELFGLGRFDLVKIDFESNFFIIKTNSQFAKEYKAFYGQQDLPVDFFLSGELTGAMESICGKKVIGIETQCIAKGNAYCEFVIKEVDKWDKNDPQFKSYPFAFETDIEDNVWKNWKVFTV